MYRNQTGTELGASYCSLFFKVPEDAIPAAMEKWH